MDQKKKKIKRKSDMVENTSDEQKLLGILSKQIRYIFGDPNTFESY